MADPTGSLLGALRPAPGSDELPVHRRVIDMAVFERDEHYVVVGTLRDTRPWASGDFGPRDLHHMELALVVRRSDLVIVDAEATMHTFPHVECTSIESSFADLVGLSVRRGYTSAVQDRFGRERGCSHLEFLARALGPAVIQALTSSGAKRVEAADGEPITVSEDQPPGEDRMSWLTNTCHVWSEDGLGMQKLALGWRPGVGEYPAPSAVEIRRRQSQPTE